MVAFRKLYPVLAGFALITIGADSALAQTSTGQPLRCISNAGVPPVVRAEGYTELTGDLVVECTGGNTAAPFLANFQLFLNTNITSRLNGEVSEALLMIDEPGLVRTDVNGGPTGVPTPFCVSPGPASNSNVGTFTPTGGTSTSQIPGLVGTGLTCGTGNNNTPAAGGPSGQTFQQGSYTVFRGARQVGNPENIIVWQGVPIVPPGSNRTRTIRITNVRANASGLGSSQTLIPTQIVAYISVFPQGTLPIDNPQQVVGFVQQGLLFDVRNCNNTDGPGGAGASALQCVGVSTDRFNSPGSGSLPSNSADASTVFGLRFREGFQTAFKPRILGPTVGGDQANSLPGQVFNSESGFVRPETGSAGIADSGTRVAARFVNVPPNVRLFVSTASVYDVANGASAVLVNTDASGSTSFAGPSTAVSSPAAVFGSVTINCPTTPATSASGIEIPITAGTGTAVWEVTSSNPSSNDSLVFLAGYAFRANASASAPALGQAQIIGNFAPFYASGSSPNPGSMGAGLPIPRFVSSTTATNLFRVSSCQTNLLFPYVTNFAGFDTGIAIANTSADPFNAANANNGRCTMNYYGVLANGNPPTTTREQTDRDVNAGQTLTFILSGGGTFGLRGNPNFQGYIIAQCDFLYAHGFAFITDGPIGQARVAEGYLALVLDGQSADSSLRGNRLGEARSH